MSALLQLSGVRKRFGGLVAVRDVSFALEAGEIAGLLGPNGSGKTTVLNMISGALAPSGGEIALEGTRISGRPANHIANMGIARTFQLVRILPSLSLIENVIAGLAFGRRRLWGDAARNAAMDCLASVGLAGRENEHADDLNYIDQKRLELARALAAQPRVLLLDEWLAGLNPDELQVGISLIESLRGHDTAILLVEHIMEAVRALCGRCVVMNAGEVIADGLTGQVLKDQAVIDAYLGDAHA